MPSHSNHSTFTLGTQPKPPSSFNPSILTRKASGSGSGSGHGRSTSVSTGLAGGDSSEMFKRAGGGQASRSGHDMLTRSPISSQPLLSGAQTPGVSQRLSESSLSSFDQPMSRQPSSHSSFPSHANRFGPTASLSPSLSASSHHEIPHTLGGTTFSNHLDDDIEDLDDHLHTFTAADHKSLVPPFDITSWRGWANGLTLAFLLLAVIMLFGGYPIITYYSRDTASIGSATTGYNLGGINSTGQYPSIAGLPSLVDVATPMGVRTRTGFDGKEWTLVFSDEFEKEGRTFYPGDDPFFTAVDLHYWPTGDFEWYDPSAITTKDGHLLISLTQEEIHDLNFKSGMLQSWNQLCFNKNAYFEVSASLPGTSGVGGFWPGIWTFGNLGRPGYGATTEGLWPYSYDSCDIGTLANQTYANGTGPAATLTTGANDGPLSYLPGQRLSACTCPGESHPGPSVNVGRSAPEIDMIEAQIVIDVAHGQVSQSYQLAPYDDFYQFQNTTPGAYEFYDNSITAFNTYLGGYYQQAASALTMVDDELYFNQVVGGSSGQFAVFGFEYSTDSKNRDESYITWVSQGKKSWTLTGKGLAANPSTEIGQRVISEEPMTLIFNLAMSNNFQNVDFANMLFPNYLRIDYIRVWQRSDGTMGCDPDDHPTADYIAQYSEMYNNPNLTTFAAAGGTFPKNSLIDTC